MVLTKFGFKFNSVVLLQSRRNRMLSGLRVCSRGCAGSRAPRRGQTSSLPRPKSFLTITRDFVPSLEEERNDPSLIAF